MWRPAGAPCQAAPSVPLPKLEFRNNWKFGIFGNSEITCWCVYFRLCCNFLCFDVLLPQICHFCVCRARRGNPQLPAKSSPYAGPSAGTEVARFYGSGTFCAFWRTKAASPTTTYVSNNHKQIKDFSAAWSEFLLGISCLMPSGLGWLASRLAPL